MIRITLMDGSLLEIPRDEALELLPYRHVYTNKLLKSPVEALLAHRGKLVPVLGPLPDERDLKKSVDERPWILLMKGCAQIVLGLPNFDEEASSNLEPLQGSDEGSSALLDELESLLKSAA